MSEPSTPAIDLERWRALQESLTQVLGLNISLIDLNGLPLTRPTDMMRSPWSVLTSSSRGFSRYTECVQTLLAETSKNPRPLVSTQVGGLHLSVVPIKENHNPVGYFLLGPCLVGRRGEADDYISLAKEFDIPIHLWMEALQEIKVISFVGLNAIGLLLQQLGPLFSAPEIRWEQLLDTAIQAVNAQAGSILVRKPATGELVIQAVRDLDEAACRAAPIRIGEGVAGMVAAEKIPLRINRKTPNPRLEGLLKRPQIQDAMVVPVVHQANLVGVLCVSTSQPGGQLRDDGLELLRNLIRLAQGAPS